VSLRRKERLVGARRRIRVHGRGIAAFVSIALCNLSILPLFLLRIWALPTAQEPKGDPRGHRRRPRLLVRVVAELPVLARIDWHRTLGDKEVCMLVIFEKPEHVSLALV